MKKQILLPISFVLLFIGNSYAQECKWTEDDINNGTISIDRGSSWTISEWLAWYNSKHSKVCNVSNPQPEPVANVTVSDNCRATFNPYSNPEEALACYNKKSPPPADDGWRFKIGKTYIHPYYQLSVTILGLLVNINGVQVFIGESRTGGLYQFPSNDNPKTHAFYQEQ